MKRRTVRNYIKTVKNKISACRKNFFDSFGKAVFVEFSFPLFFGASIYLAVSLDPIWMVVFLPLAAFFAKCFIKISARWSYCHLCRIEAEQNSDKKNESTDQKIDKKSESADQDADKKSESIDQNSAQKIEHIRVAEQCRKIARCITYLVTILLIAGINWCDCFKGVWLRSDTSIQATILIVFSLSLFWTAFGTISRQTFRKWPVYILSAAVTILFLIFMNIPYNGSTFAWGLVNISEVEAVLNRLTNYKGVIAAPVISGAAYLVNILWEKRQKKLMEDIIKETRRQLLSHWNFRPMWQLSDDSLNRISLTFATVCLIAGVLVFVNTPAGSGYSGTEGINKHTTSAEAQDSVDFVAGTKLEHYWRGKDHSKEETISVDNDITIDLEAEDTEVMFSFSQYMFFLAVILVVVGLIMHRHISDRALIESEYYYLLYHSLDPIWGSPIRALCKQDFFQVLSYTYSNGSTIKSEEREWHELYGVIEELYRISAPEGQNGKTAFLSQMLSSYTEIKEQIALNREIKEEGNEREDQSKSQNFSDSEIRFSKMIMRLLDKCNLTQEWMLDQPDKSLDDQSSFVDNKDTQKEYEIIEAIKKNLLEDNLIRMLRDVIDDTSTKPENDIIRTLVTLRADTTWNVAQVVERLNELVKNKALAKKVRKILGNERIDELKKNFEKLQELRVKAQTERERERESAETQSTATAGDGVKK